MPSSVGHRSFHCVSSNIRIVRQDVCVRVAMLDAAKHGINRHPRAANDRRAALDGSIDNDEWVAFRSNHEEDYSRGR